MGWGGCGDFFWEGCVCLDFLFTFFLYLLPSMNLFFIWLLCASLLGALKLQAAVKELTSDNPLLSLG